METKLHKEIEKLKVILHALWEEVERNLSKSIESLEKKDKKLAEQVIEKDILIDLEEVKVEEKCLKILALYHPVAIDLRIIIGILKINNSLERISDLSVNISKLYLEIKDLRNSDLSTTLKMAEKVKTMLDLSKKAFMEMDEEQAKKVCSMDDEIDQIHSENYKKDLTDLKDHPYYTCLNSFSRNLERIADYATNICEDIVYMIKGKIIRHGKESHQKV